MEAPFDPDRAVAVLQGGKQRASGYALGARLILTCEHFLRTGELAIRPRTSSLTRPATLVERFPSADVAILHCEDLGELPPVTIGLVEPVGRDSMTFEMYGWPLWSTERGTDGALLEGGRLVRGTFEPSDTSPDNNLVLQPTRMGGNIRSGWTGMSGAAVFSLDRLVAVQRRLLNPDDASSIEARPLAPLFDDPTFASLTTDAGILLDQQWAPRRVGTTTRSRLELHGPSRVPLLSTATFIVRVDGWPTLSYSFSGVRNSQPQHGSASATPQVEIHAAFVDADQVGTSGRLLVEASGGERDERTLTRSILVEGPEDVDLASGYETVIQVLERVRAMGSPSTALRAAKICEDGLRRLRAATRLADHSMVASMIDQGLAGAAECLATERSWIRRKLADQDATRSEEVRQTSKYAFHRAYAVRSKLREQGLSLPADERTDEERDIAMTLLGFRDYATLQEHLDPGLGTILTNLGPFERTMLKMLQSGEVDLHHPDFTGAVPEIQAKTYDLVNALITEGWARWARDYRLTLTQVGRAGLNDI
ncbi:serine protease [Geodermatophilus sp. SYSU D00814]